MFHNIFSLNSHYCAWMYKIRCHIKVIIKLILVITMFQLCVGKCSLPCHYQAPINGGELPC